MKHVIFLFIPLLFLSSCSIIQDNIKDQKITESTIPTIDNKITQSGTNELRDAYVNSGSEIQGLGSGFTLTSCSLLLNQEIVMDYSMIGCKPSQKQIQDDIFNNISHTLVFGDISIDLSPSVNRETRIIKSQNFEVYSNEIINNMVSDLIKENSQKKLSEKDIQIELKNFKNHYSFETRDINGIKILIHKRDFYSLSGNQYEVHIDIGNNQVLIMNEEFYPTKLDNAIKSLRSNNLVKDFGSGFTLIQNEDYTILNYNGKVIKTWSHTPPKIVPFVWDEACTIVWRGFEKLPPDNQSTAKQGVWDALNENEKRGCMKENYATSIHVEVTNNPRFYRIFQSGYEWHISSIFDTQVGNIHQLPENADSLRIAVTGEGISVDIDNERGEARGYNLLYDENFSNLISKKLISW